MADAELKLVAGAALFINKVIRSSEKGTPATMKPLARCKEWRTSDLFHVACRRFGQPGGESDSAQIALDQLQQSQPLRPEVR